ncbi:guanylate kinase [Trematosphaeria pertusa]|uniref:Guanylate kinase n=1 Tax=Trematosphaeria pertusa TaxID=390896 RepID=A0A6A6J530_9PLEO|nr:guanylate kinase [Trematosphaeria pertusa]KAF2256593.1 guanylate kinase [Trematosphaeria pertusa]
MPLTLPQSSAPLQQSLSRQLLGLGACRAHSHSPTTHTRTLALPSAPLGQTHKGASSTLLRSLRLSSTARCFALSALTMAPPPPATGTVDTHAIETNRPIVISGPSGAGKSTILKRLFEEFPDKFGFSISHTTRSPRASEKHGREYHFVTKEEFLDLVDQNGFIEHAQFGGNHYGTSIKAVEDIAEQGRICILDIEMEGVKQVAMHPTFPRPRFLFLSPPSEEVLEQRLRGRASDKEEAIQKRLKQSKVEMEFAKSPEAPHDKIVVNDDLDKAYQEVREFIIGKNA